jgi:hypothetical protein
MSVQTAMVIVRDLEQEGPLKLGDPARGKVRKP